METDREMEAIGEGGEEVRMKDRIENVGQGGGGR